MTFTFRNEVRPIITMFAEACMACNAVERHGLGPYGYAFYGIIAIVRKECGKEVADIVNDTLGGDFGGNKDYTVDVEHAVAEAMQDINDALLASHD